MAYTATYVGTVYNKKGEVDGVYCIVAENILTAEKIIKNYLAKEHGKIQWTHKQLVISQIFCGDIFAVDVEKVHAITSIIVGDKS